MKKTFEISEASVNLAIKFLRGRCSFSVKWNLACIQEVNRSPFMATTALEINPKAVAVGCYERRVQELTNVITSQSLRFRRIALGNVPLA
jgi:hypothetical protein